MFKFTRQRPKASEKLRPAADAASRFLPEVLEGRVLLSTVPWCIAPATGTTTTTTGTTTIVTPQALKATPTATTAKVKPAATTAGAAVASTAKVAAIKPAVATTTATTTTAKSSTAPAVTTVAFSTLTPALQGALTGLAQGTTIAATQQVNVVTKSDGIATYSAVISVSGAASRIAVDASGNPLEGKVAFSATPAAVQTGLAALFTTGTIPATQLVQISTGRNNATLYTTTVTVNGVATPITVDSTGTAITRDQGNCGTQTTVAFSTLSDVVKAALTSLAQGTTIADAQQIGSYTKTDGTIVYSAVIAVNGKPSRVSVDSTGKLLEGTIQLSAAPALVQTGLAALVTADTLPATLPGTQLVKLSTKRDGTAVYSTTVTVAGKTTVLAVDATGAAVTAPIGKGDDHGGTHGPGPGPGPGGDDATHTTVAFSTLDATVKAALSSLSQGVAIADTQLIESKTKTDGTIVYSTVVVVSGQPTHVAVDSTGKPLEGTIALSATPAAVQTGLQALVTADTIPTTLPGTQLVRISAKPDGTTTVYSTTVTVAGKTTVIAVDATGAVVTKSSDTTFGGSGFGPGGPGGGPGHGPELGGGGFNQGLGGKH